MWPEANVVDQFLRRVRTRVLVLRSLEGAVAGCLLGAVLSLAGVPWVAAAVVALLLALGIRVTLGDDWRFGWWRSRAALARRAERRTPVGRNLIVTAAELPDDDGSYVNGLVMKRAAQIAGGLELATLFPLRRLLAMLIAAVGVLLLSRLRPADVPALLERALTSTSSLSVGRVVFTVTPPAYSGLAGSTATNPSRLEVLANSRIEVAAEVVGSSVRMETLAGSQALSHSNGTFRGSFIAATDGYVAVEPRDSSGTAGPRFLVGLSVTEDRPPRVSLTAPGRDLFFSTVPGSLPVAITADDDIELASLQLRYTAVSGSGERFTFVERDVPVSVTRSSQRSWAARGTWNLAPLELAPGDLVVYRAVATDRRPGAAPVESESYVIEVVTPGAIAAEGFAADDQRDRYAVSQQMVILKTERLIARRATTSSDSVADEARLLAAEQRQVRAEFVFMMGGELEDLAADAAGTLELNEVAEAEAEGDLLAGRLQNQGRVDMMRAIRSMSRASAALTESNLDQALRDERTALENLMRAFSRSRFILRALTQRERIDLERRLSGALNLAAGLSGPMAEAAPDDRAARLRRLLKEVASLPGVDSMASRTRVTEAALALVRADPGSEAVRSLVDRVQRAARSPRVSQAVADSLVAQIVIQVGRVLPLAPNATVDLATNVLQGALRDAVRRRGLQR